MGRGPSGGCGEPLLCRSLRRRPALRRRRVVALHPTGQLQACFKVWLQSAERHAFRPGDRTVIVGVDGWKIALAICRDASRPEHAGEGAEAGADIYAVSALYSAGEDHRLALHLGARAMDTWMYGVLANLGGTTDLGPSAGGSGFWGPDERVIRQAAGTGTEVLTATLQHDVLDRYAGERQA